MALIFRILSVICALTGIGVIALISIVWVDGQDLTESTGKIWVETHSNSLVNLQTLFQRHLGLTDFWDNYAVAYLELPAWMGMIIAAVLLLFLAMIFALAGRKRVKSGNKFKSTSLEG